MRTDYVPPFRRLRVLNTIIVALFGLLVARLWQLQVWHGAHYLRQSEENRIRDYILTAPRGVIYDRHGRPLVSNRPAFTVAILPLELKDAARVLPRLAQLVGMPAEEIRRRIDAHRERPFEPVRIRRDVGAAVVARIEEHRMELPGVVILVEPVRHYLYGPMAAHVFGYLGEINEEELRERRDRGYRPGDLVGKAGVERVYESVLRGVDGRLRMEVDALGRPLRVLQRIPAVPGRPIVLTLDLTLQKAAFQGLRDGPQPSGAVVAMDPRSGEILALESQPAYDPNEFAIGITSERWQALTGNPLRPLLNRALGAAFEPGSVFKIVTAVAALEEGLVGPTTTFYAPGYYRLGRWVFRDLRAWGTVTFLQGIQNSINVVFYTLGYRLGGETLAAYAHKMGLGAVTGIDLTGEVSGTIPSPATKQHLVGEPWYPGDAVNMSIGQGAVTVTPLQVARMIASVANGGTLLQPHVLLQAQAGGRTVRSQPVVQRRGLYDARALAVLRAGLRAAVERGTGRATNLAQVAVAGKTGSAENPRGKPHAWFAGYAPADAPRLVVVAFVEHGFRGGMTATPIVRRVMEAAFPEAPAVGPEDGR
ncbi:MAG: penicillin-binding protein 2 [Armatimonadota bacterium]|nr:penicillin-binding protein 2 [Armatimonadota bacterium]MDR7450482.1 penicillin-binding protein 2 [Armatimonadota bacterium]MDR7466935.1 penicillin-binding protein 2 [Armatimonadota bacterium]MDR7493523.1 penicillin-binding protein 2 [Armatimonadota bacterium]MDR7498788.1 penicillin-binding protein 2 [Armatimonadota bacterium]